MQDLEGKSVIVTGGASGIGRSTAILLAEAACLVTVGVMGLVRSASCEYSKRGVRINAVLPGATLTPMFDGAMAASGLEEYVAATHPIGRFARPDEIGNAIRWLISDEASYVTGSGMAVDGGNTSV